MNSYINIRRGLLMVAIGWAMFATVVGIAVAVTYYGLGSYVAIGLTVLALSGIFFIAGA